MTPHHSRLNDAPDDIDRQQIEAWYRHGMELQLDGDYSPEVLDRLACLIDAADDLGKRDGLQHALRVSKEVLASGLDPVDEATLHYFVGNAHTALWTLERKEAPEVRSGWQHIWDCPQAEQVILSFRQAVTHPGFPDLPDVRRCEIHTNLGNTLSTFGLAIEALAQYDEALKISPSFGMARGNRGQVADTLAYSLFDPGHQWIYAYYAHADLATSLTEAPGTYPLAPGAKAIFETLEHRLRSILERSKRKWLSWNPYHPPLGDTDEEQSYRRWCLHRRLFLNPLNDLGPYPIAAADVLSTPPLTLPLGVGPKYQGAFNQIKQGYTSARYLLFEGVTDEGTHFSDRDVVLINTLDYPCYGLALEKVKLAFRAFYGLFDQIAFLLNDFLELGIKPKRVGFRTLWYDRQNPKRGLRADVINRQNGPLHALFWLGKDLYEEREGFIDAMAPDARRIAEIRNQLEHRYLKVLEHVFDEPVDPLIRSSFTDTLAYPVSRWDLEKRTLRLAQTARAAIIYLALAMHVENVTREKSSESLTMPVYPTVIDDEWKRRW